VKTFVYNGWAAGIEAWNLCTFEHDWIFDYLEQLEGLPARILDDTDEALLVGFSMGGATAMQMLLRSPEKVRGLVLISATARMMEDPATGWKGMSLRRRAALKLGTQMAFRGDPSPMYREDNMDRGLDFLQNTDLRAELTARRDEFAHIPVRLFQSEKDAIVRAHNVEFLNGIFPQAVVTRVPGSEHVLPVTIPHLIDEAIKSISGS